MARATENKQERLAKAIAEAVGAGKIVRLPTVDFSDPNRPKTCLEVDFPILPINHVAAIEGNAGKPIYQMSKWWARRRSSVFRAMLIAAATKAPEDPGEAAKLVWDAYYANHQHNEAFRKLKVADIFMGGGTTVVEGARLGMQMYGNDLNPVAWFVVKNELAQVDSAEVKKLLAHIEAEVKPQIMPFYACDCPRGHKGKWTKRSTGKVMGADFDPLKLKPEERVEYEYKGPEVIYTYWCKHGPCQATECNHRTPIMSSPVIAVKTLTVKAWADQDCKKCRKQFDIEQQDARMAPAALFVVAPNEKPFAVMDGDGRYKCPHCGYAHQEQAAAMNGESVIIGKGKNKSVELTLLIHPDWLKGAPGTAKDGTPFGGSVTDTAVATAAWTAERDKTLKLIEVRGMLPEQVTCPDNGELFFTDHRGGNVPKKANFVCRQATCGKHQVLLQSIKLTEKNGPTAMYAIQGYCSTCDTEGKPYGGRFFSVSFDSKKYAVASQEWDTRSKSDLKEFWPRTEIPFGSRTHVKDPLPKHGFTHWWMLFNSRQLLVHALLLKSIVECKSVSNTAKELALSAFQQYLRNQNMFCIWDKGYDKLVPMLSNSNFAPKITVVENCVFPRLGRGNWTSCINGMTESLDWCDNPWELVATTELGRLGFTGDLKNAGKSVKVYPCDKLSGATQIECQSSSDIRTVSSESYDLIITDPPFGELIQYSELADFFYVWLRLFLLHQYPNVFLPEATPKALEAVSNDSRHPDDPDGFYQRVLTECWKEANRILKPSGILAFTFHHSEDEPWVAVLESLFDAGFYLEGTYPIRSDETKGEGEFGSQKIEFDIIHVCRKRTEDPEPVSWARLRRQIMQDVRQLQNILEQHQQAGLQAADLQVIRRGKALEYYSKHYGKVYVERGRGFSVRDALVGINQLLDDEADTTAQTPPVLAEPYTRQFLRLFADRMDLKRDQMQKFLRGTGVSPQEFIDRGWCQERQKVFYVTSPLELARGWKGVARNSMARDFDQATFMVGACFEDSGIKMTETLDNPQFMPHPATRDILDWLTRHGGNDKIKAAARTARQLYNSWLAKNEKKVYEQRTLFDLIDEDA